MAYSERLKKHFSNPNVLTMYRVFAIPGLVVLLLFPNRLTAFFAALIFSIASITDALDGFFARRLGLESSFGKVMDPVADKLLVSSAFIMMTSLGWVPAWIVCIIIGREMAVTGLRNLMAEGRQDVSASNLGKYKTGFQIAAIIPLLIHYPYLGIQFHLIGMFFLWCALLLTVWSGADYFLRFRDVLKL
ncbi:MAG: CDP-diacylglycerol--glycerol-3-phosphate 3-phosphatidyltransferase [Desulfobacteraceae bacterium]|jgi:CDP-diacylglycerol--glycerol-3-phosphate 3-phosphatidyltransferase|nr:CDP-diacylglycerol--glycerol-3-phosphate 3-phosphatidyltransferase [Desulfobacteraceae bacterium]MBC2749026.1 CDP-diacylglycerol--glycerol-3-phosphate 3-phosphatidyltransferase [Desulfobacteraceae bacterium]